MVFGLFRKTERTDPICGMREEKGKGFEDEAGHWFCSPSCKAQFLKQKKAGKKETKIGKHGRACCQEGMIKMKKISLALMMILLMASGLTTVYANGEHDFGEAEAIIENKIPCNELTDAQLEELGDYYMELMHPGEAHELMDARMGGEGSESLKAVHINMGRSFYCRDSGAMMGGMMGMMGTGGMGMMGTAFGMMGDYMAGSYSPWGNPWWMSGWMIFFWLLFWGGIIWFVVWLIRQTAEKGKGEGRREGESALVILGKRYAKGELTKKQYQQMRKALGRGKA